MSVTPKNWKNTNGTANSDCSCGSWKQHWIDSSRRPWPERCSVASCSNEPTIGAHISNTKVNGVKIVPMCASCHEKEALINLGYGITLVSAETFKQVVNDPLGVL